MPWFAAVLAGLFLFGVMVAAVVALALYTVIVLWQWIGA